MATSIGFNIYAKDNASAEFLKVAAAVKLANSTVNDMGASALGLTKLVGGAGLIPVLAGATAVTLELGTALGAAAGAGGIFGLSVAGFVKGMVKDQQSIARTRTTLEGLTKGTSAYHDELVTLHNKQTAFNQDFGAAAKGYDAMHAAFSRFLDATGPVTKGVLAKGFGLVASVLPKLVPVSNAAGKAIGGLIGDLQKWVNGPGFAAVLHWFETSGPKAITHFGHSVGNVFVGLGGIFKNFIGPGDRAAKTMETLTGRFAKWGNSKGVSASVDKFLRYVSGDGGKITSVLDSLAKIAPKLATALGGLGSTNLSAISMFLNLLAGMNQGTFDVLVKGLFGIAVAAKAASIVGGLVTVFKGAAAAMTFLGDAAIGTRIQLAGLYIQEKVQAAGTLAMSAAQKIAAAGAKIWAGAQWLLNAAMDANPIGLVVLAVAALAVGMVIAYKKSATFRAIVQGAFHGILAASKAVAAFFTSKIPAAFEKVKSAASKALGWVKSNWPLLLAILSGPFGLAVLVIARKWDSIKSGASAAVGFVKGKFGDLVGYIRGIPGSLANMAGKFLSAGKTLGGNILSGVIAGLKSVSGFLGGLITAVKNAINSALHLPLSISIDKGPIHIHATVIPAFASGVRNFGGGMAVVGERGPEIVTLPRGSNVYPNGTGPSGSGGGDTYITVNASGLIDPQTMARQIEIELTKLRRVRGGLAFQS